MTPEQWRRVNDLYHAALDTPVEHRGRFVQDHASDDRTVAHELQRLLEIDPDRTAAVDRAAGNLSLLLSPVIAAGDRLNDRYRIVQEVGSGGMGQVYEAFDEELNTRVALKIIRPELANEPRVVARFKQEVQLARQVTHRNVCRAFDLIRVKHRERELLVLCMEFMEGETLSAKLRRDGKMKVSEAEPIIQQVAAGLAAAHAAGVVHRDLKSGNIFLSQTREGELRVVIADFGLAGNLVREEGATRQTASGWGIGTPAYMAPEQVEGGQIGPPADIYAFGVVMYEMATGQVPYEGQTPLQVAVRRLREKPRPPRELDATVDGRWESAILRCLEVEPADRFVSATDVASALHQVRWLPRLPRWVWAPRRMAGTSLSMLALVIVALYYFSRTPPLTPEADRWYNLGVASLHEGAPLTAQRRFEQAIQLEPKAAILHARLAEAYLELDMADRARDSLVRASQLAPDRWRMSSNQRRILAAIQARSLRDFPAALSELEPMTKEGGPLERSSAWLDLGRVSAEAGNTAAAVKAFQTSANLDRQSAAARLQWASMLARQQKLDAAAPLFDEARKLFELSGNKEGVTEVLVESGRALQDSKRLEEAGAILDQAMLSARAAENRALEVRVLFAQSLIRLRQGDWSNADALVREGLSRANGHGLEGLSAQGLNDLGSAALTQYRLKEAAFYLNQAISLAERGRNQRQLAQARMSLANLSIRQGNAAAALPLVRQSRGFYQSGNFVGQRLLAGLLEVDALAALGRQEEALALAGVVQRDAESSGNPINVVRAIERRGYIHRLHGNFVASVAAYQEAVKLQRSAARRTELAYALINLGDALALLGKPESRACWEEAERLVEALGASGAGAAARLAQVQAEQYLRVAQPADAIVAGEKALAGAADSAGRKALAQGVLAYARAQLGDWTAARKAIILAASMMKDQSMSDVVLPVSLDLARAEALMKDVDSARRRALEIREKSKAFGLHPLALRASALLCFLGRKDFYDKDRQESLRAVGTENVLALERTQALPGK